LKFDVEEVEHNLEYQVVVVDSLDVPFVPSVDKHSIWIDDRFVLVEVPLVVLVDHNMIVVKDEDEEHYHHYNYCHNFVVEVVDQH
jgi:hypothetical protein